MWEIFQSTGHIGAYLVYRECLESDILHPETLKHKTNII
ncbi:YqzL family protein [Lucifera butyrica]